LLRDYEILFIVRPDLDDEHVHEAVGSVDRLIANLGGATVKTDIWGRRRLAYEVRHLREGQYVLTDFRIDPSRVPEMEATLKISDTVFRHLIVRKPEKTKKAAPPAAETAAAEATAAEATAAEATAAEATAAEAEPQATTPAEKSESAEQEPETVLAAAGEPGEPGEAEEAEEGE
jgi:small subunit ribosomal protein S6